MQRIDAARGFEQPQDRAAGQRQQDGGREQRAAHPSAPALIGNPARDHRAAERRHGGNDGKDVEVLLAGGEREEAHDGADPAPEKRRDPVALAIRPGCRGDEE